MGLSWRSSSGGGVGHEGVADVDVDVDVDATVPPLSSKTISLAWTMLISAVESPPTTRHSAKPSLFSPAMAS
nr:hypothetical protein CFP56_28300 [Quercus suber]POE92122.1 hypothetical protein CFP56_29666 [Quercus suber]POF22669.1 hypothetical protein CFP56_08353 [Quercus suber]